jgi:hypothetical protein
MGEWEKGRGVVLLPFKTRTTRQMQDAIAVGGMAGQSYLGGLTGGMEARFPPVCCSMHGERGRKGEWERGRTDMRAPIGNVNRQREDAIAVGGMKER